MKLFLSDPLTVEMMNKNMEVTFISIETIKPSLPTYHLQSFKLSLLDQLTPLSYSPLILFYELNDGRLDSAFQFSSQLKGSLAKTLNSFYPLSGRLQDNILIQNFQEGVPYVETRVNCLLSDFLQNPQMELLNRFLPCQPCRREEDPKELAQVAVQANIFGCGGLALGVCFLHKIVDGITMTSLVKTWAANTSCSKSTQDVGVPDLFQASLLFPPQESIPPNCLSFAEGLWFSKRKCATRRFVFDANAITSLKARAKGEIVENPTRVQALCAFIWQRAMAASKSISSGSFSRPCIFTQAVNIRRLTESPLSERSIGNLFLYAMTSSNLAEREVGLSDSAVLIRESVARIDNEHLKGMSGDKGSVKFLELLNQTAETFNETTEKFGFSSWVSFGLRDINFGKGKPIWIGVSGETNYWNFTTLTEAGKDDAIEAWMTLDDNIMAILENDHEFLAFAAPNPSIC